MFYHQVVRRWPIIPVKDPNGHYVDATYINQLLDGGVNESQEDQLAQQLALVLTPIKDWNIHLEFNYRANNTFNHQDWQTVYGYDADDKPYVIDNSVSGVYEYAYKSNYFNPNFYTDYTRSFGDHNMKVMLGYQSEWLHQRLFTAQQKNMISGIPTLNTTTSDPSVTGGPATWSTAGFFGRLNYDYKGRYLFEANLRYDGSSRSLVKRDGTYSHHSHSVGTSHKKASGLQCKSISTLLSFVLHGDNWVTKIQITGIHSTKPFLIRLRMVTGWLTDKRQT